MMGGEIAEAAPRRRRNDWLGFCQARTAARLRKVGDEPQAVPDRSCEGPPLANLEGPGRSRVQAS